MHTNNILESALVFSEHLPVFPLSPMSTIPLKGSHGYKDATKDKQTITNWFTNVTPKANLAFSLARSDVFVVDIDMKSDKNGVKSIESIPGFQKMKGTPIVKTPNGGFHVYYRTKQKIKQQQDFLPGVDILTLQVVAPPSVKQTVTGKAKEYELIHGSFDQIKEVPAWLLKAIVANQSIKNEGYSPGNKKTQRKTTYVAKMIEELIDGAKDGQRNVWLTRQAGRFLSLGVRAEYTYEMLRLVNSNYVWPPLKEEELSTIMKSVIQMEITKTKGEN